MAVTETTIETVHGMRVFVSSVSDAQTLDLVKSWTRTWDSLQDDWDRALTDLTRSAEKWPSQTQIRRSRRTLLALSATEDALNKLASDGTIRITGDIRRAATETARWESLIIASQLPQDPTRPLAVLAKQFDRVDPIALSSIVERSTKRITNLAPRVGPVVYSGMVNDLVRGIALGSNPLAAARKMFNKLESGFMVGLHRMNIIARTEMLDAVRESSLAQRKANEDVLGGWEWWAELDERACPACWSMHGEVFPHDTPGPDGHPQCRCTALPVTKSWKDLGFDIEEPESLVPDAEEVFNGLDQQTKLEIMGPGRLALLDSGQTKWSDLSTFKPNPDWRGSYVATPVSQLAGAGS